MGEYLAGDRRVNSPYDIRYLISEEWRELCTVSLTADSVATLVNAIEEVRATLHQPPAAVDHSCAPLHLPGVLL